MICKQNEAKVFLTQIVGDKVQKVDLCESCAKTKGINEPGGFSLADLLLGLGASQEIAQSGSGTEEPRCPNCGFTQADFKKAGRLGCSECYTAFSDGMENLLKSMHKGTKHIGKVPTSQRQSRDLTDRLKTLNKRLEKAIATEDFEQAALLRDEIKATKAQIGQIAAAEK